MPLFNIIKNSAYYWCLAGLNLAFWIYRPSGPTALPSQPYITYPALLLYVIGELGNLHAHITLRNLRRSGSTDRGIPRGGAFELVTCPNYMFEVLIWVAVMMVTRSLSTALFSLVAFVQMGIWGRKKESRYRREFGGEYRNKRWVMLPGIW
jgi:very-long-chain enoyl-CoA reductase